MKPSGNTYKHDYLSITFSDKFFVLVIIVVVVSWFSIISTNFHPVVQGDWDQSFTFLELQRKIILNYHQLPLWNPYLCGGEPWLAHPSSSFLSPYFLIILIFGTITGTFIIYFFQVVFALLGMYFLSRYYNLSRSVCLFAAILLFTAFHIIIYFSLFNFSNCAFLPWIYLFFNKGKSEKKYLFYISLIMAYLVYAGGYYVFIIASLMITIGTISSVIFEKKKWLLKSYFGILLYALLLSSLKLIPMMELILRYPRYVDLPALPRLFDLSSKLNFMFHGLFFNLLGPIFPLIVWITFILSLIFLWKEHKSLIIMNITFLLLSLGDYSLINLWRLWCFFFPSFNKEHRIFLFPCVMVLALSAGLLINKLRIKLLRSSKSESILSAILISILCACLFINANKMYKKENRIDYFLDNPNNKFSQIRSYYYGKMFDSVYNNYGVICAKDSIGSQINTPVISRESKDYKGEYFLANNDGALEIASFSPGRLEFKVDVKENNILIINQNYFPGWHSTTGPIINYGGLLGLPVKKEHKQIIVYYLPVSLIVGGIITISSILILIYSRISHRRSTAFAA